MKLFNKLIIASAFAASLILLLGVSPSIKKHHELSQFISPDTCGSCHSEIFDQWENSMHNLSQKDPVYSNLAGFLLKGLTDKDEIAEAESCVKCHVPVGYITGYPEKLSDDKKKIPELATHGIQCDYCHSATSAEKLYNNDLKIAPGNGEDDPGIKRGPFKDSNSDFHESEFSEFHTSSKICGTCHNVRHVVFGTNLETTYEEWKNGPYNSRDPQKMVTCQGCHMYQRPGIPATGSTDRPKNRGRASDDDSPVRGHIFTHYFVGGNSFIPGQFNDRIKRKMAEERLKNAATISINHNQTPKGEQLIIQITNTGAGHYLPTGLTDIRQMWLEIIVKDEQERIIYSSGRLDRDSYIPGGTIIYNTVFGDGKGNPVMNIAKAREILKDKRIPPLKSVNETITLPKKDWKYLAVNVKLLYRSAPQKILDMVSGKGKLLLPVITMAEAEKKVTSRQGVSSFED
ncbi:MAG: cytochrome c554 family protein [Desulfobacteraceae bacterium]|nr:cytochrome c554 family protein [Desulfobacteraceae bacterium]